MTEFCSGGSLRHLLINSRVNPSKNSVDYMASTLNHRELLKLAVDVANGMAHLSSQKVSSAKRDETRVLILRIELIYAIYIESFSLLPKVRPYIPSYMNKKTL